MGKKTQLDFGSKLLLLQSLAKPLNTTHFNIKVWNNERKKELKNTTWFWLQTLGTPKFGTEVWSIEQKEKHLKTWLNFDSKLSTL
jgi:hypothetical protein